MLLDIRYAIHSNTLFRFEPVDRIANIAVLYLVVMSGVIDQFLRRIFIELCYEPPSAIVGVTGLAGQGLCRTGCVGEGDKLSVFIVKGLFGNLAMTVLVEERKG